VLRRSKTGGSWVSTQNLLSTHFLFTVLFLGRMAALGPITA